MLYDRGGVICRASTTKFPKTRRSSSKEAVFERRRMVFDKLCLSSYRVRPRLDRTHQVQRRSGRDTQRLGSSYENRSIES